MARTIRDAKLDSRDARRKVGPKAVWRTLIPGSLHLGYRRKAKNEPGLWLARRYKGGERYQVRPLGLADDFADATPENGVLNFAAAQREAYVVRWGSSPKRRRTGVFTVTDAIADYIEWLEDNRATARDAQLRANAHIIPTLGRIAVTDLTAEDITSWMKSLAESPALMRGGHRRAKPTSKDAKRARRATANRTLTILKAALNKAFRAGAVKDVTAWRQVEAFERVDVARTGFLSVEECRRLINAAEGDFKTLVMAALFTGARYKELYSVLVRDFAHGKLHIREPKIGPPRWIVLTEEGIAFFERLTAGRNRSEPMLLRGDRAWSKSEQARPMREACAHARIVPPVGFHQLRHSYASLSVEADMPLMVLAKNLGHTSTRMVEKHYAHLRESFMDVQVKAAAPKFGIKINDNVRAIKNLS